MFFKVFFLAHTDATTFGEERGPCEGSESSLLNHFSYA